MSIAHLGMALALVVVGAARAEAAPAQGLSGDRAAAPSIVSTQNLRPVDDADMAGLSGGQANAAITDQTLNAVNTGNSIVANTVVNGAVTIGSNAFSGFAGVGNFVINTGNNNNLQGTMSVNIVMTPP
jgi:hypothetical protein